MPIFCTILFNKFYLSYHIYFVLYNKIKNYVYLPLSSKNCDFTGIMPSFSSFEPQNGLRCMCQKLCIPGGSTLSGINLVDKVRFLSLNRFHTVAGEPDTLCQIFLVFGVLSVKTSHARRKSHIYDFGGVRTKVYQLYLMLASLQQER